MADVITNAGKAIATGRLKGTTSEPKHIAWGTGAGTAAATDTTLFTEASESRIAGTSSRQTTTLTNDTYQVTGAMVANASKTITNAGLFDASSGGNLYVKSDFVGVAVDEGDAIVFTFKVQY